MIDFTAFKARSGTPIYTQIVSYIKRSIVSGAISDGDELPSRRMLSSILGVNPNTVQKSYKILEEENLIRSKTGTKSYIILTEDKKKQLSKEIIENDAINSIVSMKEMGLTKEQVISLIERYWGV